MIEPAIFTADGDVFRPSGHARGPWDPDAMHGGAPMALLARAIERLDTAVPMRCLRLSGEFAGPVAMAPVTVSARLVQSGRRLAFAQAELQTAGRPVVRARATLLRVGEVTLAEPAGDQSPSGPPAAPAASWPDARPSDEGFHLTGMEVRFAQGDWGRGKAIAWFRLRRALVAGEAPTALQRTIAAADFGNGISRTLDFATHLFVNTDLTVHLHREPAGEWVGLDARTDLDRAGLGQATSVLSDEHGRLGIAAQSLYVAAR